jgi:polysaccharide pyruvyl transferase CsaB
MNPDIRHSEEQVPMPLAAQESDKVRPAAKPSASSASSETKRLRIVISGYYGYGNSGDEAVLHAILASLRNEAGRSGFEIEPIVLSIDPPSTEALHGVRAVHRFNPLEIVRCLRESDGLVSGGGSLLQDVTGLRTIPYYLSVIKLAQWLKKPTFIYAQGMGPIKQKLYYPFIRAVYKRNRYISLRDRESVELLHRMDISGVPVDGVADPVMGMPVPARADRDPSSPVIGVSVRLWHPARHDLTAVAEALRGILERRPEVRLHFLAFHPPKDRIASEFIVERLGDAFFGRIRLFESGDNPRVMLEQVNACDLMIGMRLHSLIYAVSCLIPIVGISYDPKIDQFLKHLGMEASGSTSDIRPERIAEEALALLDRREQWIAEKKALIDEMKQKSQIPAQQICHYLRIEQRKRK